ncbi:MAG: tRNA (guanosine(46)-N7)-methyltransferase TrmB [Lactobacillaceae bacterium]|jgi:tRNA (guanine-N7-)-methyltransferase|nr:tRNA (guanosine(46)-N7)-methyltransferase TrmB [Lactobacillaceae bacterium]
MRLRNKKWANPLIEKNPQIVIKNEQALSNKGEWGKVFQNNNDIYIEIGSGKGRFIIENAIKNPDKNFIGIEIQETAVGIILQNILALEIIPQNLKIIFGDGASIENYFVKNEINKIYLNHSDPWPKARHEKRRLTYRTFLESYKNVLPKEGQLEFKTDNRQLFDYSVESFRDFGMTWDESKISYDLHSEIEKNPANIMTEYEEKFSNKGQLEYWILAKMPKDK